jgi:aminopeptidase N
MENTSATLFNTRYVVDSTGFQKLHKCQCTWISHQWFGNLVTAESGKHHWLQEGFATHYVAGEKEIYGEDHFIQNYMSRLHN